MRPYLVGKNTRCRQFKRVNNTLIHIIVKLLNSYKIYHLENRNVNNII